MEGKANISIANLDDTEKETVTLTYIVKDCGDEETAKSMKKAMDKVAEEYGADIHTGEEHKKPKKQAAAS